MGFAQVHNRGKTKRRWNPDIANRITSTARTEGLIEQAESSSDVISAWDEMFLAKSAPGKIECPFVAGMNITSLPTATFSVAHGISQMGKLDSTDTTGNVPNYVQANLGSSDYILMCWMPVATLCQSYKTIDHPHAINKSTKLGGLSIVGIDSSDLDTTFFGRDVFIDNRIARSMDEVFDSDMIGFSSGGFVWASEILAAFNAPQANLVGNYWKGSIQWG